MQRVYVNLSPTTQLNSQRIPRNLRTTATTATTATPTVAVKTKIMYYYSMGIREKKNTPQPTALFVRLT